MSPQHLQILWRQLRAGVARGFFTLYDFLFSPLQGIYCIYDLLYIYLTGHVWHFHTFL